MNAETQPGSNELLDDLLSYYENFSTGGHLSYISSDIGRERYREELESHRFLIVPARNDTGLGFDNFCAYRGPEFEPKGDPSNQVRRDGLIEIVKFAHHMGIQIVIVPTWVERRRTSGSTFDEAHVEYKVYPMQDVASLETISGGSSGDEILKIVAKPTRKAIAQVTEGSGDGVIEADFQERE